MKKMFMCRSRCSASKPVMHIKPLTLAIGIILSMQLNAANDLTSNLKTIVVTAEKKDADLQKVSSSIAVIDKEDIEAAEINSLTEISRQTPSLNVMSWGGRRDTNIFIRGIGPGLFTPPTASVYVDGVNMINNGMFDMEMLGINSVEILRGPQGTLYGGNSLAGVINIKTQSPDADPSSELTIKYDDLGRKQFQARTNNAIIEDQLYFDLAAGWVDDDGHIHNSVLNENADQRDDKSFRGKVMWKPNEDFSATLIADKEHFRGGSYVYSPLAQLKKDPSKVAHNFQGQDNQDSKGLSLNMQWDFDDFTMTSVTGWRKWENLNSADSDGLAEANRLYHSTSDEEHAQLSHELRFASSEQSSSPVEWIGGLYYYQADSSAVSESEGNFGYGTSYDRFNIDKEQSGYAAFGQVNYHFSDQWSVTGGLRFDHEERSSDGVVNNQSGGPSGNVNGDKKFNEWLPKAVLTYQTDDNLLMYGSVAKGYRAGGFDDINPNLADIDYNSEQSINYELGMKVSLLDNKLELNSALFFIDLSDQQVQTYVGQQVSTQNAGASTSKGFELEARYLPIPSLMLNAGLSYTDASFDKYSKCSAGDCSNNAMPFAPDWSINAAVQHRTPVSAELDLFTRLDWQHTGQHYFDAENVYGQGAFNLFNFKMGVESEQWDTYLWTKNLLDASYKKVAFNRGFGPMASTGDPRSAGITFKLRF